MKRFDEPTLFVDEICVEDIIATSSGIEGGNLNCPNQTDEDRG